MTGPKTCTLILEWTEQLALEQVFNLEIEAILQVLLPRDTNPDGTVNVDIDIGGTVAIPEDLFVRTYGYLFEVRMHIIGFDSSPVLFLTDVAHRYTIAGFCKDLRAIVPKYQSSGKSPSTSLSG